MFTPEEHRGCGHARALVEAALESARVLGHDAAILMSEIGGEYYERLGFLALPAREAGCLPFLPDDLDALVAIHDDATHGQRFPLLRDRPAWEQALFKAELRHRLKRGGGDRIRVVERHGAVAAYVVLREVHGARFGSEEILAELFSCALIHARRMGVNRLDAWQLPAVVTTRRLYPVAQRPMHNPVIMLRPLGTGTALPGFAAAEECRLSWLDLF